MPIPFYHPKPRAPAAFNGQPLPLAKANILSQILFSWVAPIMKVGQPAYELLSLGILADFLVKGRVLATT